MSLGITGDIAPEKNYRREGTWGEHKECAKISIGRNDNTLIVKGNLEYFTISCCLEIQISDVN